MSHGLDKGKRLEEERKARKPEPVPPLDPEFPYRVRPVPPEFLNTKKS